MSALSTTPLITTPPTVTSPGPATTPSATTTPSRPALLRQLGGVALAVAPLLFIAGLATAPPAAEATKEADVASLADHTTLMAVSANLLHYSWFGFAFGLIAVTTLVAPGARGRALTTIAAVLGAIGAVQISGLLLGDFFISALANHYSVTESIAIRSELGTSVFVWMVSAQVLAMLPLPLVFVGLARARVLSWKSVAPLLLMPVAMTLTATGLPSVVWIAVAVVAWLPAFLAARQLVTGVVSRR